MKTPVRKRNSIATRRFQYQLSRVMLQPFVLVIQNYFCCFFFLIQARKKTQFTFSPNLCYSHISLSSKTHAESDNLTPGKFYTFGILFSSAGL